jgi:hypothetical protein
VPVGYIKSYALPGVIDREKLAIKCFVKEKNKDILPSFVNFDVK